MMDLLDRVTGPAADLLARVDDGLLAEGAPAGHPIWPLLRRAGALPGDAVAGIAALRLEPVRGSAAELRQLAGEYTGRAVDVPADWTGTAATAYAARAADLSGYLRDSAGRLTATAEYLDDVADWMVWARGTLAEALAVVLGSAEAVLLHGPAPDRAAGATIGVHVLDAVLAVHDEGRARHDRWAGRLDEVAYRPAPGGSLAESGPTTVPL